MWQPYIKKGKPFRFPLILNSQFSIIYRTTVIDPLNVMVFAFPLYWKE